MTLETEADPVLERTGSLTTIVREKIERMILSGEIAGGERLNENALAAQLNVSRGPLREATWSLEQAGLVQIVRNRGVFVRKISLEDALHLYDVRSGLARVAGRLLASRVTAEQIAVLTGLYEALERARETQDQAAYNEGNRRFHASLVEFTGNARLISYHETTEKELRLFVRRGVLGPARLRVSNGEHKQILDCIVKGDDEGAAAAFERHILNGKRRMLESLSSAGM
ncbi:FCD domain-containing protein [Shumkonia mesophila]|uniref:FCD domain-containing protein n=1 Tax=Shumkonia mesophila TaxID=2838854 RepID=UPI00293454E8|nr:FCD domain-containing protein [Shumkonia mesophila]